MHTEHKRRTAHGLTLIELLITLAIAAIVLALAVPGVGQLIASSRMTTAVNTLIANLQYARSEAVSRAELVSLCPEDLGTDDLDCGGANWHAGYIVFANPGEADDPASQDDVLRSYEGNPGAQITITGEDDLVSFVSLGSAVGVENDDNGNQLITFEIRDTSGKVNSRDLDLSPVGYVICRQQCSSGALVTCGTRCN